MNEQSQNRVSESGCRLVDEQIDNMTSRYTHMILYPGRWYATSFPRACLSHSLSFSL